jgi:hypothetical protein
MTKHGFPRSIRCLLTLPPLVLLLLAVPATARELTLRDVLPRADVVVLAKVDDPPTSVTDTPVGHGAPAYPRYRRHLVLVEALKGKVAARLDVDEPAWRTRMKAHAKCRGEHKCAPVEGDAYQGELSREPVPGTVVLVFLHRSAHGELELVADRAMDTADKAAEVRAWLQAHPTK